MREPVPVSAKARKLSSRDQKEGSIHRLFRGPSLQRGNAMLQTQEDGRAELGFGRFKRFKETLALGHAN